MARPKKTIRALDKVISVRIDQAGHTRWRAQAYASDMTIGEWARIMIQGNQKELPVTRRPPPPAADPKLLAAVGRCGNNLNQLARAANRHELPDQRELLARLIDIDRKLDELLRYAD